MSSPASTAGRESHTIVACAAVVFLGIVAICAFFVPRNGTVDELGLLNPVYTLLATGSMTYPVHYMFGPMVVHPPLHYTAIAALLYSHIPLYYAEAIPAVVAAVCFAVLTVRSSLQPTLKFALLAGALVPLSLSSANPYTPSPPPLEWFGLRPEGELLFWWLAGLVALEHARRTGWPTRWSVAGSLLLAYASALHYYAAPALAGVVVYAAAAYRVERDDARRRHVLKTIIGPAAILVSVYALTFVLPNLKEIRDIIATKEGAPHPFAGLTAHFAVYDISNEPGSIATALTSTLSALRMPAALLGLVLLMARRSTRVLAIAAAPVMLIVLFAAAKHGYYIGHEMVWLAGAIVWCLMDIARALDARAGWRRRPVTAAVAAIVLVTTLAGTPVLRSAEISLTPRVHEMEIARAAGQQMLGGHALVAGRISAWYASGASGWYGVDPDLLWRPLRSLDVRDYARRFDAVVESPHMSEYTSNDRGQSLASWYADGTLSLRGVFIAETNAVLSYWLLSAEPSEPTLFFLRGDLLYRGTPAAGGDHLLATLRCQHQPPLNELIAATVLRLPPPQGHEVMVAGIDTLPRMRAFVTSHGDCRVRDEQPMLLSWTPAQTMRSTVTDRPAMRFYRDLTELPARQLPVESRALTR